MQQSVVLIPVSEDQFFAKVQDIIKAVILNNSLQEPEKLLSPAEACKIFQPKISKVTLHQWTKDGLIPVHRMGGRIYYKHSDLIDAAKKITKYSRDKMPA